MESHWDGRDRKWVGRWAWRRALRVDVFELWETPGAGVTTAMMVATESIEWKLPR